MPTHSLIDPIHAALRRADQNARKLINTELLTSNWEIGKILTENENPLNQVNLSLLIDRLHLQHGVKLIESDLQFYKTFYKQNPILHKVSKELCWAHYLLLIPITDELARAFYQWQAEKEKWSPQVLKKYLQIELFEKFKQMRSSNKQYSNPRNIITEQDLLPDIEDLHLLDFMMRFQHKKNSTC